MYGNVTFWERGVNSDIYGKFFMLCFEYIFGAEKGIFFSNHAITIHLTQASAKELA